MISFTEQDIIKKNKTDERYKNSVSFNIVCFMKISTNINTWEKNTVLTGLITDYTQSLSLEHTHKNAPFCCYNILS